jgi:hypothetical protein
MTKADLTTWTKDVRKLFYLRQNPEKKPQMEAYIKNKFVFFGVSSPERKIILKEAMSNLEGKAQLLDAAEACYEQDEREFHYLGMELLFRSRSIWKADVYDTLKSFVTRHSWWDTVDSLASNSFGAYFKMFPEMVELSDQPNAFGTYPGGQSGNPASAYYSNRIETWASGSYDTLSLPSSGQEIDRVLYQIKFAPE